jgi:ABC-type glucose/galactose transport system permease subunit
MSATTAVAVVVGGFFIKKEEIVICFFPPAELSPVALALFAILLVDGVVVVLVTVAALISARFLVLPVIAQLMLSIGVALDVQASSSLLSSCMMRRLPVRIGC